MDKYMDKWTINESLLQSYRSIFISSQAFLLAVGAIVSDKNPFVLTFIAILSLSMIWFIWFPVVTSRHRITDYYKYGSQLSEADRSHLCSESAYVHKRALRSTANKLLGIQTNWRETRIKMDLLMPVMFSSIWLLLMVLALPGILPLRTN